MNSHAQLQFNRNLQNSGNKDRARVTKNEKTHDRVQHKSTELRRKEEWLRT